MNTPNNPAPTIPPLPPQATWDQQMRHFEAQQRERSIAATASLRDAQQRAAAAAETLVNQPMPQGPNPRRAEVLLLVSTMTSAQRAKPVTAVATALAMLQALDAAGL